MTAQTRDQSVPLTPVAPSERVELIDILRGFALLGILTVNFWGSSSESTRALDKGVSTALDILVSSSFYPLFSFLFGLGFAVQLLRARERGGSVVRFYVRRLLALFLIGSFHAVVIWDGDILVLYSIAGFVLLLTHRLSDRWLLTLAAIPLVVMSLGGPSVRAMITRIGSERNVETMMLRTIGADERRRAVGAVSERSEMDSTVTRATSLRAALSARWHWYQGTVQRLLSRQLLLNDVPAIFLIGFVIGRRRILQEAARHRVGLTRAAAIGLTASVIGTMMVYWVEPDAQWLSGLAWNMSDYGTTVFYVSAIALGVTFAPAFARAFHRFAPAGRIGLTNYLLQSITMTVLFSHYGFSLTPPPTAVWLAINLVFFFGVQLPLSRWYVQRFRFGPAEWVWRSLTYGELQPMRLAAPASQPVPVNVALSS